jgi:putative NADH-flavin reductase
MKILVLGANGFVGSHLVEEAALRGHEVTPGVRGLVDATDPASVAEAAAGHDVVLSAVIDRSAPETVPRAVQALLAGLERAGVGRLVVVGGAGTLETAPGRYVMGLDDFNPDFRAEAIAHLEALRALQAAETQVEWICVTPPRRFDDTGRTGSYRVGGDQLLVDANEMSHIAIEDFAVAVLDEAENPQHSRTRFTVAY